ncbi:hypothetical protein MNBD_GAMMA16-1706 [hydrothermal vent metagenome]|uniref:ZipA C-terminal FtsZ-binding domain-containing protein n=1 Tax=hydrothermal vent metagenome TaxID=652676 RepID=A0A3B0Z2L2_9ZZZZ
MELSELLNSDTLKLTILPALLVIVVLFFWFRQSGPNSFARRKRKHGRSPGSRHDNLEFNGGADGGGEVYFGRRQALDDIGDEIYAKDQDALNVDTHEPYDDFVGEVQVAQEGVTDIETVPLRNDVSDENFLFQRESEPEQQVVKKESAAPPREAAPIARQPDSNNSIPVDNTKAATPNNSDSELEEELKEGLMLALNVIVGNGRQLRGSTILKAITAMGFTYGSMGIFHYYSASRPGKRALFSLANMMEPGNFNLKTMEALSTPGLTLFANITRPAEAMDTFFIMLETANKLAESLDATVCDERRGTLSKQGVDHIQEEILEYQRRSKLPNNPPL